MNNETTKPEAEQELGDRVDSVVSCDELKEICGLVVELTKLRQDGCKHLCIENFAPDLFATLLGHYSMHKQGKIYMPETIEGKVNFDHVWEGNAELDS